MSLTLSTLKSEPDNSNETPPVEPFDVIVRRMRERIASHLTAHYRHQAGLPSVPTTDGEGGNG